MAHDDGFEPKQEQLYKGYNDSVNSDDPYNSDNHAAAPKVQCSNDNIREIVGVFNRVGLRFHDGAEAPKLAKAFADYGYSVSNEPIAGGMRICLDDKELEAALLEVGKAVSLKVCDKEVAQLQEIFEYVMNLGDKTNNLVAQKCVLEGLRSSEKSRLGILLEALEEVRTPS